MKLRHHPPSVIDLLAAAGPFASVDRRALAPLAPSTDQVHVREGTVLAREETPVREFVSVIAGSLVATDAAGHRRRLLPGDSIGAAQLPSGATHAETIVADADADLLVVNGPAFRWAVAELLA